MNKQTEALVRLIDVLEYSDISASKFEDLNYDCLPMLIAIKTGGDPHKIDCKWECNECPLAMGRRWKAVEVEVKMEKLMND